MNDVLVYANLLGNASARMEALAGTTAKADAYLEANCGSVQQSDGRMFAIALRDHASALAKARSNVERSGHVLEGVARNLEKAQQRYDATEDDNVVAVDDIFVKLQSPTTGKGSLGDNGSTATTFGSELPGNAIPAPSGFSEIPEWAQLMLEFGGSLISPTYWAMKVLSWTTGVNPMDWFVGQMAGDWRGVSKSGGAFKEVGGYWADMAGAISADSGVLFRGWNGDAADSAESYFRRLIEAHREQRSPLSEIGSAYVQCGAGMYFTALGMSALLGTLMDIVFGASILAAAIAVAMGSVVGAPAAAAMLAELMILIDAILGIWATVIAIQGVTVGACYLFCGVVTGFLSTIQSVEQLEMPGEG